MAYWLGVGFGAVFGTLLISRLTLWLFKKLGDNQRRIFVAYGVMYVFIVVVGGLGFADGGPPRFGYAIMIYTLPALLWLAVDLFALKGRIMKGRAAA